MRRSLMVGVIVAAGVTLSACGGGGSHAAAPPATTQAPQPTELSIVPTTAPAVKPSTGSPADRAAVTATWTTFFSSKTSAAVQQSLLQNAATYTTQIAKLRQLMSGNIAARVDSIQVNGSSAAVTYDILSNGSPLLSGSTGTAVKVGGKWLVSSGTFCGLATLAGAACTG